MASELLTVTGIINASEIEALCQRVALWNSMAETRDEGTDTSPLYFYFDSPGGELAGVKELVELLAQCPTPVIGIIGNTCGSAAYWIASQCSELWALSLTTRVGGVGVMLSYRRESEQWEQFAGKEESIYAPQSLRKNEAMEALRRGDPTLVQQQILAPIAEIFQQDVLRGRGERLLDPTDEALLSGTEIYASEALGRGWIDAILGTRLALKQKMQEKTQQPQTMQPVAKSIATEIEGILTEVTPHAESSVETLVVEGNTEPPITAAEETPTPDVTQEIRELFQKLTEHLLNLEELVKEKKASESSETKEEGIDTAMQPTGFGVAPVSGVGALSPARDNTTQFCTEHASDILACVHRVRESSN